LAVHEEAFDFGLRLKALRDARGMSQEQLARQVGVSKGTISRYEGNVQVPLLSVATKLALALGTSLDTLVGLESSITVRLPDLPEKKREILMEFLHEFVESK